MQISKYRSHRDWLRPKYANKDSGTKMLSNICIALSWLDSEQFVNEQINVMLGLSFALLILGLKVGLVMGLGGRSCPVEFGTQFVDEEINVVRGLIFVLLILGLKVQLIIDLVEGGNQIQGSLNVEVRQYKMLFKIEIIL
ncbi:hypothetical protein CEXT_673691 [Caerostris extrusa]|uniref:Uncharacterized protein n=1 Tax=Caerostris extrusa TaxID=172846 RepID=A0AAV4QPN2_CAEEX|nr:hypothetical protein CEXT_673691 [Caerostris extrusa]